jgi:hypothetical protein
MTNRSGVARALGCMALGAGLWAQAPALSAGQSRGPDPVPRTADGRPDLQGIWDYRTLTPLERPREFAGKEFFTDEEAAAYERRAELRPDGRPPDDERSLPSVHPVWWLDYGKKLSGSRRTSLVVDPPDGRIPPLTAEAQARAAAARQSRTLRGSADGAEDRSLWERCVTRGLPEGMLPSGYNNFVQFVQTPSHVVILSEMIHDARIVSLDGRPHAPLGITGWMGDSRGRWEGDTLVVETTNFSSQANFRGSSSGLRLTERFTRTDRGTLGYEFTVEDATTWTRPWTVAWTMTRSADPIYEYACHEGNYGLKHILLNARAAAK